MSEFFSGRSACSYKISKSYILVSIFVIWEPHTHLINFLQTFSKTFFFRCLYNSHFSVNFFVREKKSVLQVEHAQKSSYKFNFHFLRWVFSTNKKSKVFVFEFQVGINWVYHISWNLDLIFINGVKVYKIWDESFLKLQYIKILRLQIHITVWVGQYCQINLADVVLESYWVSIILTLHTLLL